MALSTFYSVILKNQLSGVKGCPEINDAIGIGMEG